MNGSFFLDDRPRFPSTAGQVRRRERDGSYKEGLMIEKTQCLNVG